MKTKRRNKILRHNNKHTQTFFKKQKLLPTILLKIREKNLPPPIITSKTTMFSSLKNIYNFNEVLKTTYYNYYILCNKFFALYFLEKTDISKHFLRCFTDYKV